MKTGRIVRMAVLAFLFFLFVALDLVLFGVIALDSMWVTLLPLVGVLLVAILSFVAARRTAT